jgi:ATP-dependent DNA helicase UvrD/PcrA
MLVRRRKVATNTTKTAEELLKGLNAEQRKVVKFNLGAALVVAVAGSGKTRALVHRIAYLISALAVNPATILAVTFSKKAAEEMNERLRSLGVFDCRVGTWHSLCWEIVRAERPEYCSWDVDTKDRFRVIVKMVLGYQGMNWKGADLTTVLSYIGICKAHLAEPGSSKAAEIANELFDARPCAQHDPDLLAQAYFLAQEAAEQRQIMTFDDMLVLAWDILRDDSARARWAGRWNYMLQDEAQDENIAQVTIAEQLAGDHGNYMCVGDPAQSIYGFRGAVPEKLLAFEKEWGATVIQMHRNYRSANEILEAANGVISSMDPDTHLGVMMKGERGNTTTIHVNELEDMDDEGESVVDAMLALHEDEGVSWRHMTTLYRTNAQSRGVEEVLIKNRVPYVVIGGTNFYNRKEVKDLLGYLRVAANQADEYDFKRCINTPFRFLGKAFTERVSADRMPNENFADTVRRVAATGKGIQRRQKTTAFEWAGLIDGIARSIQIREEATDFEDQIEEDTLCKPDNFEVQTKGGIRAHMPAAILERIISDTGFIQYLTRDEGAETVENNRVSNVRELVRAAERFTSVPELLKYIDDTIRAAEEAKRDKTADRVTLCSLHRSKGLEWPAVWIIGANENILPHKRAEDIEEERRLFYVGITRAMNHLTVSCVRTAAIGARVVTLDESRFISEAGLQVAS